MGLPGGGEGLQRDVGGLSGWAEGGGMGFNQAKWWVLLEDGGGERLEDRGAVTGGLEWLEDQGAERLEDHGVVSGGLWVRMAGGLWDRVSGGPWAEWLEDCGTVTGGPWGRKAGGPWAEWLEDCGAVTGGPWSRKAGGPWSSQWRTVGQSDWRTVGQSLEDCGAERLEDQGAQCLEDHGAVAGGPWGSEQRNRSGGSAGRATKDVFTARFGGREPPQRRHQFLFLPLPTALGGTGAGGADWYSVEEILLM